MSKLPLEEWPLAISEEPTRSTIEDTVRSRVTILKGGVGLELAPETSMEESLHVFDWTKSLSDHVQFMIGDLLLFAEGKWGPDKYNRVLNETGRADTTLRNYRWVAKAIPPEKRIAALSFTHHKEIACLREETKIDEVLKEVGKQAEKKNMPSVKALRDKVKKLAPPKVKKAGKAKKKDIVDRVSYEPKPDEQAKIDDAERKAKELGDALNAGADETGRCGNVFKIVAQLDNQEKRRWLEFLHPIIQFYNMLDRVTGY